jgi:hydroxymethylglutaryl-CoA lyase
VNWPERVTITEVGPRDGLQNESRIIDLEDKVRFIDALSHTGLTRIEAASFVSPKAIPQMKDARIIAEACAEKYPDLDAYALVPNLFGAKAALESGIRCVDIVVSLSESHNKANINRTHEQSFAELQDIRQSCPELRLIVDVATAFGCPFEGIPAVSALVDFVGKLHDLGIRYFSLGDTIGIANPRQVRESIGALQAAFSDCSLKSHFHDTRNNGIVNTIAAIECGVTEVETALGGLGGCPFAPGASGNTATEDLIWILNGMGYETGIDFEKLTDAARAEYSSIEGNYSGHQIHISADSKCFR